jgi:hypothetical protein
MSWGPPFSGLAGGVVRDREAVFRRPEACGLSGQAHDE